jgi:PAS domain S-box-containing protein
MRSALHPPRRPFQAAHGAWSQRFALPLRLFAAMLLGEAVMLVLLLGLGEEPKHLVIAGIAAAVALATMLPMSLWAMRRQRHDDQALLDNAIVGIVHLREQRVANCNRRFEELFGFAHQELIGQPIDMIYPTPTVYAEISRAAYATIDRGGTYSFELSLRRRDGSSFWAHLSGRAFDRADPAQGSIWIFTDESERKEAIDAVLEAQAYSDAIINSLPGIFYLFGKDGRMLRWNANLERELGHRRRDIARATPYELIAPEARDATRRLFDLAATTGRTTAGESVLRSRDGQRIPYFLTANSVEIQGQGMIVGVGIDLTARKAAEEQVRHLAEQLEQRVKDRTAALTAANRELESFSYSVSHDLSAPLRGIDGFARIIEEEYASLFDADGRHYLQRIRAATKRMQGIIDDMLSLSRISRNELVLSSFDLAPMAAKIFEDLRARYPERQVETVVTPDLRVSGDANLVQLALENLLRNAWKFTSHHPTARIELGQLQGPTERVYFVRDDGAGFDMRYAGKLFREFQRMHPVDKFEGTGIGLAIVNRVISRHAGRVWAEAAVEQGATFFFTLPGKARQSP